eukprot:719708-Hanusia_phi.AAC.1
MFRSSADLRRSPGPVTRPGESGRPPRDPRTVTLKGRPAASGPRKPGAQVRLSQLSFQVHRFAKPLDIF